MTEEQECEQPIEIKKCSCGCGNDITRKKFHRKLRWESVKFIGGHYSKLNMKEKPIYKSKPKTEAHRKKLAIAMRKYHGTEKEPEYTPCKCGCGELVKTRDKSNYKRQYLLNHHNPRKGISPSKEHRDKLSQGTINYIKNHPEFIQLHLKFPRFKDTIIERIIEQWLIQNNVKYEKQKPIVLKTCTTFPDFFIEPNICIYCDGDYWHNRIECKKKDARINSELTESGYNLIRLSETAIKSGIRPIMVLKNDA